MLDGDAKLGVLTGSGSAVRMQKRPHPRSSTGSRRPRKESTSMGYAEVTKAEIINQTIVSALEIGG